MPELNLETPEGKEGLRFPEFSNLMAVMHFPNDPASRKHYMASKAALLISGGQEEYKKNFLKK